MEGYFARSCLVRAAPSQAAACLTSFHEAQPGPVCFEAPLASQAQGGRRSSSEQGEDEQDKEKNSADLIITEDQGSIEDTF